ncbi:MAG: hypothetical protein AAB916_00945, partial [Patescibacteria group bacterium]
MENHRVVMLRFLALLFGGAIFLPPIFSFAYNPLTTHAALTQEIIALFNRDSENLNLTPEETEIVIQGSVDEDAGARALYHFYDPVRQRGLVLGGITMASSKEWANTASLQAKYDPNYVSKFGTVTQAAFSASTDYSWERAIYEYAWGDKTRALQSLGHVLHLLEDATVPDHTRNDPHPHVFGMGSPYEDWTNQFDRKTISGAIAIGNEHPIILTSLRDYFDAVAGYSNNNFFSEDTILKAYDMPVISSDFSIEYHDDIPEYFVYSSDDMGTYRLVKAKKHFADQSVEYSIDSEKILSSYFSHLSRASILHGAGIINLFFAEVAEEQKSRILYDTNRSWLGRRVDAFKRGTFGVASALYGSSVTLEDLEGEEPVISSAADAAEDPESPPPPYRGLTPVSIPHRAAASPTPPPLGNPVSKATPEVSLPREERPRTDDPIASASEATSTPTAEAAASAVVSAPSPTAPSGGSWGPEPTTAIVIT